MPSMNSLLQRKTDFALIQSFLSHQLSILNPPTSLVATAITSKSFSSPFAFNQLLALSTTFRHATLLKRKALKENQRGLFSRTVHSYISDWGHAVLDGLRGGQSILRLTCCTGLLLGLQDLQYTASLRSRVENQLIIAFAELLDLYSARGWEKEFLPATEDLDAMTLCLVLSSHALLAVETDRLAVLPLQILSTLLTSTIDAAFHSGQFVVGNDIDATSPLVSAIGPLSKLCARIHPILTESRPTQGLRAMQNTADALRAITARVERDWTRSPSADGTEVWTLLKTLLFAILMITESTLSTIVYLPPPTPAALLAQSILTTLSHLAFVIAQFGGVTNSGALPELRRAFYLALDVLATDAQASTSLVHNLLPGPDAPSTLAKTTFALACVEQLLPVLAAPFIEHTVLPFCTPLLLIDPTKEEGNAARDVFEAAHSVALGIFAAADVDAVAGSEPNLVARLVPFYTTCLIENSAEGHLSTPQLCLAFGALVRGARSADGTLARFCIDTLMDAARVLDGPSPSASAITQQHRLHLALVSALPTDPWGVLEALGEVLRRERDVGRRKEVMLTVYEETVQRVGDREREGVMRWWVENRGLYGAEERARL